GVLLFVLGATGLGTAVRFIPRPVVVGFTNGIAVLIASTQIKDFFGLKVGAVPGEFIARMELLAKNFKTLSVAETTLACLSLAVIIVCMSFLKRLPGAIAAMIVGTSLAYFLKLPIQT